MAEAQTFGMQHEAGLVGDGGDAIHPGRVAVKVVTANWKSSVGEMFADLVEASRFW